MWDFFRHPGTQARCCRSLFWVAFCRQDARNEIRILCLPHFSLVLGHFSFFLYVCYLLITLVYIHFVQSCILHEQVLIE